MAVRKPEGLGGVGAERQAQGQLRREDGVVVAGETVALQVVAERGARADTGKRLSGPGLLENQVDGAAGAIGAESRGLAALRGAYRPLDDLDALQGIWVEKDAHGGRHRQRAAEAGRRARQAADGVLPRGAVHQRLAAARHAGLEEEQIVEVVGRLLADEVARQHINAGRQFLRRRVEEGGCTDLLGTVRGDGRPLDAYGADLVGVGGPGGRHPAG